MPIKVRVDRSLCIGCGVAPTLCSGVFVLEDGKNRIVPEFPSETNDEISIGEVSDELKDCVETAAKSCPVEAISFEVI